MKKNNKKQIFSFNENGIKINTEVKNIKIMYRILTELIYKTLTENPDDFLIETVDEKYDNEFVLFIEDISKKLHKSCSKYFMFNKMKDEDEVDMKRIVLTFLYETENLMIKRKTAANFLLLIDLCVNEMLEKLEKKNKTKKNKTKKNKKKGEKK